MTYFSTFFTHSGAIKFSKFCIDKGIPSDSGPVPRKLSSNCGIGVKFEYDGPHEDLYIDDMERVYTLENNVYTLIVDYD